MRTPSSFANLAVFSVGALWGLYWVPFRAFNAITSAGPWATFAVLVPACAMLAPAAWRARGRLRAASHQELASVALGGASFALYSTALVYGQVAVVILLFYLSPVWSTLIARLWLRQPVAGRRYAAIIIGLAGIVLVLYGNYAGLPVPHTLGDWLGLLSGMLWAVASTGIHQHSRTGPMETNFLFCFGAAVMALVLALALGLNTTPQLHAGQYAEAIGWLLLIGGLWWAAALTLFMWAAQAMEPARVSILLMSEVIVGAISAALFAAESFGALMIIGTALVIAAGALETLPTGPQGPTTRDNGSTDSKVSRWSTPKK